MKILELRFKNLNSLYGEWVIDFTSPEYVSNGIFALTGPTGAGKSTILDAICLALYGSTPRLGKITKSGNEIMSRQTWECYAEVLFESQAGRFRCHWEQRRARKKYDGKLQDQEHQIIDGNTGSPIETKKSLVSGVIEEKTGMDFDRFTRSILLAQGGFDTFLKADVEQKSKILEQITGTEIYSEISRRVHERRREEQEKVSLLEAETSGIIILTSEQEEELQQNLKAMEKEEIQLGFDFSTTEKAIAWLRLIDQLKKEITTLAEEEVHLQSDIEGFKPERENLNRAIQAASLDGLYATLTAVRKQQSEDLTSLKEKEKGLPQLESDARARAQSFQAAEQHTITVKEDLKTATPLIREIRALDQKLAQQHGGVLDEEESCREDLVKIDLNKQARKEEIEKRTETEKKLETSARYIQENQEDQWLIGGLAGVQEQLNTLILRQNEIVEKESNIQSEKSNLLHAEKRLEQCRDQSSIGKQDLKNAETLHQKGVDLYNELLDGRLLREYRADKESLLREMVYLSKISELEDYRAKLEEGKACPLCGAKEHPFATGNIPEADQSEKRIEELRVLIDRAEDLEISNKELEEGEAVVRTKLTESERVEAIALNDKTLSERALSDLQGGVEKIRSDFAALKQALLMKLLPLGITEIPDNDVLLLLNSLQVRLERWQSHIQNKVNNDKEIAQLNREIGRLEAVIETQSSVLAKKQKHYEDLKKEYAEGNDQRKKLYEDKNPDDEEGRFNQAVADAEATEKRAGNLNTELQQRLNTVKSSIETLKSGIKLREAELKRGEPEFSAKYTEIGFLDEKQFLKARLSIEQREDLSEKAQMLDRAQTDLNARKKDRHSQLTTEIEKKLSERSLEEMESLFLEYEQSLKELRNSLASLNHRLNENIRAAEQIKEKKAGIELQKKESLRWEKLHGLIGSADGKKYRNFAQGLTYELMVSHANKQLEKMTDRYLLIRNDEQPLELNVVDNYQAGEIRSTKNLSGGESFIISLTLALGLSKMASRKVRVDSLFLDEGFGTLDEEALETALDTLSGLQQDGKLIGIISHVLALKERISTQITIAPLSGGRSDLSGPGCGRV